MIVKVLHLSLSFSVTWQKDRGCRQLSGQESGRAKEMEDVLVKLVRLLANLAVDQSVGSTLACSSAAVMPLLSILCANQVEYSEELVLNVVSAITNLLSCDGPSNLLLHPENRIQLCRHLHLMLLDSDNIEVLTECARALGNLLRYKDVKQCVVELRLDTVLVILLGHEDRELVFHVCGALINLAADVTCRSCLFTTCAVAEKLAGLLKDAPSNDAALQLVVLKLLVNLSADACSAWALPETVIAIRKLTADEGAYVKNQKEANVQDDERQTLFEFSRYLLERHLSTD